ncbi:MAG TPA: hypothetical protein VG935_05260 [Patescibacteria group bacterium]|nr:hypothetical protein [Patescibacteria group bacterium]
MGQGDAGVDPKGKSITTKTFAAAGESQGMTAEEAMEETYKLLGQVLKKKS